MPGKTIDQSQAASFARLGDLEVAVLELVWEAESTTAKDAHAHLGQSRGISVNTVQSTLERLYRKGLLSRSKDGHAYHYSATITREELLGRLISEVLGRFNSNASSSAAAILDVAQSLDANTLTRLEMELKRRRQGVEDS